MTIAPCRALARFRHREKIAHKRQMRGGRIYDRWRRLVRGRIGLIGQSWEPRVPEFLRERTPIPPMRQMPTLGPGEIVTRQWEQIIGGLR